MTKNKLLRMDTVLLVVDDLEAAIAFFTELGMEIEGKTTVEGEWVDRIVGLDGVRSDIAMMRTPDGHGRLELDKFHTPEAIRAEPEDAPVNTLGIRRIMFAVTDIDDIVARLQNHGAELIGEVTQKILDWRPIPTSYYSSGSGHPECRFRLIARVVS